MRKGYILLVGILFLGHMLMAQSPENRTAKTIAADVLAQMPANKQATYNKLIAELASTGEEGVIYLVNTMNAPGKGTNAPTDYALSGLANYVSAQGQENARILVAGAYAKALDMVTEREIKAFIIRELQICGRDECVEALSRYLTQEGLSGPAARALANINTEKAKQALQTALLSRKGTDETQQDLLLAVGEAKMNLNEGLILGMLGNENENMQKVVLYAISRIGTEKSLDAVEKAAATVGYQMDKTGVNEAYIALIKKVASDGNDHLARKYADNLLNAATQAGQTYTRVAALEILFSLNANQVQLLLTSLQDQNKEFRNAALNFASGYSNQEMYAEVLKLLPKAAPGTKVDILHWMGRESKRPDKSGIIKGLMAPSDFSCKKIILAQLKDPDREVKQAAALALVKIGDVSTIPALTGLLENKDSLVVKIGQNALEAFHGDIIPSLVKTISKSKDAGKIAVLQLLALRKADATLNIVLNQIKSGSPAVKTAAYKALKEVVAEKDFSLLCGMLESAEGEAIAPLQQAVIASISSQSAENQVVNISKRMTQSAENKKHLYYIVLSATGDQSVLPVIVSGFKNGTGAAKDAAFDAIYNWDGNEAADELYTICTDPLSAAYFDKALTAYVRLVSLPSLTPENRFIFLRKAMEIAKNDNQKNNILRRIGQTKTFQAMIYAGRFLDDKPVQQTTANAVMNISASHPEYTGKIVRDLLEKVILVLDNPDAGYQREAIRKQLNEMPKDEGFVSMFNGKDLDGWKGLVENPMKRAKMTPEELAKAQEKADKQMRQDWKVEKGCLVFDGTGYNNLCTTKQYGDFEMYVDWLLDPSGKEADAGVYLRGTPQVQIWDTARVKVGAQVGSGGLYNNKVHPSKPSKVADNKLGEWNSMYIKMIGDRVTVILNGDTVVKEVILENYWDRNQPIFPVEQIELQAHGSKVYYRDLYIKELSGKEPFKLSAEEEKEGFKVLFDGTNMHEWTGNLVDYTLQDGTISLIPSRSFGGNLYTKKEYSNFVFRFEFQLTPAANNGLGIRTPMEGDAAYVGMELQILDNEHPVYKNLQKYQYHGSVYGVIPAKRGFLKPTGEWNYEEVIADGDHIQVILNGEVILDGNIRDAAKNGTTDGKEHPGLFNKTGHIGFLGHGSPVKFRNIRIKELK